MIIIINYQMTNNKYLLQPYFSYISIFFNAFSKSAFNWSYLLSAKCCLYFTNTFSMYSFTSIESVRPIKCCFKNSSFDFISFTADLYFYSIVVTFLFKLFIVFYLLLCSTADCMMKLFKFARCFNSTIRISLERYSFFRLLYTNFSRS